MEDAVQVTSSIIRTLSFIPYFSESKRFSNSLWKTIDIEQFYFHSKSEVYSFHLHLIRILTSAIIRSTPNPVSDDKIVILHLIRDTVDRLLLNKNTHPDISRLREYQYRLDYTYKNTITSVMKDD